MRSCLVIHLTQGVRLNNSCKKGAVQDAKNLAHSVKQKIVFYTNNTMLRRVPDPCVMFNS